MKVCTHCKTEKPESAFSRCSACKGGLKSQCKECARVARKEWYTNNRDHSIQYAKNFRSDPAEQKKHRDRERERLQRDPSYRDANRKRAAAWRAENKERYLKWFRDRCQRIRSDGPVDKAAVRERDKDTCYLCGLPVDVSDMHFDHVVPVSRGGRHQFDNLRVTHSWCNQRKGKWLLEELPA